MCTIWRIGLWLVNVADTVMVRYATSWQAFDRVCLSVVASTDLSEGCLVDGSGQVGLEDACLVRFAYFTRRLLCP